MKRNSFILHTDSLDVLSELTDEQAGNLFKAIYHYQKTGEIILDGIMKAIFVPFKNQFDRDDDKYMKICERNKNNGLNGGRPKSKKTQSDNDEPKDTQGGQEKADNDNKNDSGNDNGSDSEESNKQSSLSTIEIDMEFQRFWSAYPGRGKNGMTGASFKGSRQKALDIFTKIMKKDGVSKNDEIIRSCREYDEFLDRTGGISKHATTWLNQQCWEDDYSITDGGGGTPDDKLRNRVNDTARLIDDLRGT